MAKKKKRQEFIKSMMSSTKKNKEHLQEELEEETVEDKNATKQREEKIRSLLDKRFMERNIPKADEGFRGNDLSNEALHRFYQIFPGSPTRSMRSTPPISNAIPTTTKCCPRMRRFGRSGLPAAYGICSTPQPALAGTNT